MFANIWYGGLVRSDTQFIKFPEKTSGQNVAPGSWFVQVKGFYFCSPAFATAVLGRIVLFQFVKSTCVLLIGPFKFPKNASLSEIIREFLHFLFFIGRG